MRRALFPAIFLLLGIFAPLYAQHASEYQVKAAFLFNFTKFTVWPGDAFARQSDFFILGVLGKDPFGEYLDEITEGEKVAEKKLLVQRYNSIDEIRDCQILFINMPGETADVIGRLKGRSILTVSDDSMFSKLGGIVQFYNENGAVRLQINPAAAKDVNLDISSKLLRIARIVESDTTNE
jgi:hypothetical protein